MKLIPKIKSYTRYTAVFAVTFCLGACEQNTDTSTEDLSQQNVAADPRHQEHQKHQNHQEKMLLDFDNVGSLANVDVNHATTELVSIDGNNAIKINVDADAHHIAGFTIHSGENSWNLTEKEHVALAFDMENPTDSSVSFYVFTHDNTTNQLRTFAAPKRSKNTYYIDINVPELELNTGIRSNPESWDSDYQPIIWRARSKVLDASSITKISFDVRGALYDKELIVDNVRAVYPSKFIDGFMANLVDQFGQSTTIDFPNKVESVEELQRLSELEQEQLSDTVLPGRSKFSGWADGPTLEATGYFRTEKYQGKWSLVDPEGKLFFSNGIANVRMANTSTITGYDFDPATIEQRAEGDLTPEDSIGLNTAPKAAWPTRHISSDLRANMFSWLPNYDEPMGIHFGYRREVHSGALEKGETYSFYRANLARKFDSNEPTEFMQAWKDTTVKRMLSWGFTSFGNWIDTTFYQDNRVPYFANGWIIGDFKTVSSGNDYWSPLPDPFDPVFTDRTYVTVKQIAAEVNNSPWCVGVFIDNEKSWGMMGSVQSQYGVVINTLGRDANESPTKAEFVKLLKNKYKDIAQLNAAWNTKFDSWNVIANGVQVETFNDAVKEDFAILLEHYASEYFRIVNKALKELMPNHLYLGARFADWAMTPEVTKAAAKYSDVMSYNYYREGVSDVFWSFLEDIDKPSIIGEFHNGALDSGLLNPGLIHAESQEDRGVKYAEYVNSVIDNPYFVGVHWFQYIDSPLTGRAYDGENYNVGFVSVTDIPYTPLVEAATEVNKNIYTRRYQSQ